MAEWAAGRSGWLANWVWAIGCVLCIQLPDAVWGRQVMQLGGASLASLAWAEHGQLTFADAVTVAGSIRPLETDLSRNLVVTRASRGGDIHSSNDAYTLPANWDSEKDLMGDGDSTTAFVHPPRIDFFRPGFFYSVPIYIDLGAPFPVERIRFATRPDQPQNTVRQYDLYTNDGSAATQNVYGDPVWTLLRRETDNLQRVVDIHVPLQALRRLYLYPGRWGTSGNDTGPSTTWEIAELEVFGRGFVPHAEYLTAPIDLGSPSALGQVSWGGHVAPAGRVVVQSRSGRDDQPEVYWRRTGVGDQVTATDATGRPLTRAAYFALPSTMRGGVTDDQENWSPWQTYQFEDGLAGLRLLSPSPRRYVQFHLEFLSSGTAGGQVDSLRLEYSQPPVVDAAIGELWPDLVDLGAVTRFTYAVRAQMHAGQPGFSALSIGTSAAIDSVVAVRIDGSDVAYTASVQVGQTSHAEVAFPRVWRDQSLVEVDLTARVFRYGTPFTGAVRDPESDDVPLEVTAGDAVASRPGDGLRVRTSLGGRLLGAVQVYPSVLSPNDDGVNDQIRFTFPLLTRTGAGDTRVGIYDLNGRLVWQWRAVCDGAAEVSLAWNGRDSWGARVAPGCYLFRISAASDMGEDVRCGHLAVVY
jgi:hypothetical protein